MGNYQLFGLPRRGEYTPRSFSRETIGMWDTLYFLAMCVVGTLSRWLDMMSFTCSSVKLVCLGFGRYPQTLRMTFLSTPKRSPMFFREMPFANILLMTFNWCVVNVIRPLRPFFTISAMLSRCVPRKRCSGFTQARLSQEWQTKRSSGNDPKVTSYIMRCASRVLKNLRIRICPYPLLLKLPCQIQQLSVCWIRALKSSRVCASMYVVYPQRAGG